MRKEKSLHTGVRKDGWWRREGGLWWNGRMQVLLKRTSEGSLFILWISIQLHKLCLWFVIKCPASLFFPNSLFFMIKSQRCLWVKAAHYCGTYWQQRGQVIFTSSHPICRLVRLPIRFCFTCFLLVVCFIPFFPPFSLLFFFCFVLFHLFISYFIFSFRFFSFLCFFLLFFVIFFLSCFLFVLFFLVFVVYFSLFFYWQVVK